MLEHHAQQSNEALISDLRNSLARANHDNHRLRAALGRISDLSHDVELGSGLVEGSRRQYVAVQMAHNMGAIARQILEAISEGVDNE